MKILDLFSGIGGFSLAAHWLGWETLAFCEKDKFCQYVLNKHWPDVPIFTDIKELKGDDFFGRIDMVTGGFPCQPFTAMGQRKGSNDDRYLWPAMLKVIKQANPTWVVGENVTGVIQMALETVCADLEEAGYEVQALVVPACSIGSLQKRSRVFILAHSDSARSKRQQFSTKSSDLETAGSRQSLSDAEETRSSGYTQSRFFRTCSGFSSRLDRIKDVPAWVAKETLKKGYTNRIKALGNSVDPEVVYQIFKFIDQLEKKEQIHV